MEWTKENRPKFPDDEDLIRRFKKGDKKAFESLVKKYFGKVFQLSFSMTRNRAETEDLTQDIFIKVYTGLAGFRFNSQFGTWLYRIASNHLKDHFRSRSRTKHVSLDEEINLFPTETKEAPNEELLKEEKSNLVTKALHQLPRKQQIILTLRDIQGFSYEEIGKILKISPGTVDSRIHRARKMLREKLSPFLKG
ncbi:MAG: RNA polymerase sigma factor [Acidobacteriota bacterium]